MAIFKTDGQRPQVTVTTHKATPEELAEHHSFVERSERLRDIYPDLIQKYPDKRVALTEGGRFLVADSMEELVVKMKEIGERPGFAATLFLNTKPRRVIL